jgi:vancomycin resistance protein YoaR
MDRLPMSVRTTPAHVARRRRKQRRAKLIRRGLLLVVLGLISAGVGFGFAYAGSPATLAEGVRINGVDVGGMTEKNARKLLEQRFARVNDVPIVFVTGKRRWKIRASKIGLEVDWGAAVAAARRQGDGFGPVRGFRRLGVRFFGADVTPPVQVFEPALNVRLGTIARVVDTPHREAAIVREGLKPVLRSAQAGHVLNRRASAAIVVRSLTSFTRHAVWLPFRTDRPKVTRAELAPALAQARIALASPVRLTLGPTYLRLSQRRLASLLVLPRGGATKITIGGPGATSYFKRLQRFVNRDPTNATFAVYADGVRVVPAKEGRKLDVLRTSAAILRAAVSPRRRVASVAMSTRQAERTTQDAEEMGITGLVGAYETFYGGEENRIHNVQLVAHLIDNHLIAPDEEFSFNDTTGERSADKGFLEAPVIINGELQTGLGGGVCQVSTTTFNAAFEAGLKITARTNHALYISHYPQGRDATVNFPDIDLRFVNDTGHWLLLRTWVGEDRLTVALYGTPVHRKVESTTSDLVVNGDAPVKKIPEPTNYVGNDWVEDDGEPSRSTSVHRVVYNAEGEKLYDDTWYSSYSSEPEIIHVGTKPKPKPKPKPVETTTTETTTTETTETTTNETTETTPTETTPTETTPTESVPTDTTPTDTSTETTPTESVPPDTTQAATATEPTPTRPG